MKKMKTSNDVFFITLMCDQRHVLWLFSYMHFVEIILFCRLNWKKSFFVSTFHVIVILKMDFL